MGHLMAAQSLIIGWAQQARIADLHGIAKVSRKHGEEGVESCAEKSSAAMPSR